VDDESPREQHSELIESCMNLIVASSGSELSNEQLRKNLKNSASSGENAKEITNEVTENTPF
jgi:hypothetical protein